MSTRAEKALKAQKDKHHSILRELVQEPPNKTCADCLAKGPRWASWNIGVFVCIRCAGIHRNLGVHISKCKSIDLDSWTQEQLEQILRWGNKRAALHYECYLPKDFARAQGNQAVETFIRNKYEKKLYMKKDGEPEPNNDTKYTDRIKNTTTEKENKPPSSRKKEQHVETRTEEKAPEKTILNISKNSPEVIASTSSNTLPVTPNHVKSLSMSDLLLVNPSAPADHSTKSSASTDDLLNFGAFSDPVPSSQVDPFQSNTISQTPASANTTNGNVPAETSKSTKESILSLYSTGNTNQQKMYGVPGGVYMQQQQMPQQISQGNMVYGYTQQSMPNQMQQMNTQMQQMAINQSNQMMTSHGFNQRSMNQFGSSGQPAFATPMYTSNSNMVSNQMNSVYQHQNFQASNVLQNNAQPIMVPNNTAGNYGNAGGQNMNVQGMNTGWSSNMMGMQQQQQQQQQPQQQQQQQQQQQPQRQQQPQQRQQQPQQRQQQPQQQQQQQQRQQQQQQQQQFRQAGSYNMNSGHMMNGNSGYTMNNQLWN